MGAEGGDASDQERQNTNAILGGSDTEKKNVTLAELRQERNQKPTK